jgi:prefoldin subunit 5
MASEPPISLSSQPTNPRGIPEAPFISDVSTFFSDAIPTATSPPATTAPSSRPDNLPDDIHERVENTLNQFQEMIAKYQYMETSTARRLAGLREKIPEVQKTLDAVRYLSLRQSKKTVKEEEDDDDLEDEDENGGGKNGKLQTLFELNDTLYAKAEIDTVDEVCLWLGVSYSTFTVFS